jgi:hypothetical protein
MLETDRRRQGRPVAGAQAFDLGLIGARRGIVAIDAEREFEVRGRVLVARIDARRGRQGTEAAQRCAHLHGGSLEQATAARAEQRIAAKQRAMAPKRDVT